MLHILFHFCPAEVLMLCVSVLYVQIGVRLRRTYVLQHILFFKSNVLLQTPDPRAGVLRSYEIPEQQDQPQPAGAAAQNPDPG